MYQFDSGLWSGTFDVYEQDGGALVQGSIKARRDIDGWCSFVLVNPLTGATVLDLGDHRVRQGRARIRRFLHGSKAAEKMRRIFSRKWVLRSSRIDRTLSAALDDVVTAANQRFPLGKRVWAFARAVVAAQQQALPSWAVFRLEAAWNDLDRLVPVRVRPVGLEVQRVVADNRVAVDLLEAAGLAWS